MNTTSVTNSNFSTTTDTSVVNPGDLSYTDCRITTRDNPFDPFDDFEQWFLFDVTKGYNTCAYLGRIARTSDALSDAENAEAVEKAIDDIIRFDAMNVYVKVSRTVRAEA